MYGALSPHAIRRILTALLAASVVLPAAHTGAAVPQTMSYQGSLQAAGGLPPPDGDHTFTFRLYNVETGGSPLWQESQTLTTIGGLFHALLGAVTPLNVPFDAQYWLESVVDGSLLSPRVKLASAPYAQRALVAESVVGGSGGGIGGSGTPGFVPKFTAATTLGNSLIADNGTQVMIGQGTALAGMTATIGSTNDTNNEGRLLIRGDVYPELFLSHTGDPDAGGGKISFVGPLGQREWYIRREDAGSTTDGQLRFVAGEYSPILCLGTSQTTLYSMSPGADNASLYVRYASSGNSDVAAVKGVSKPADWYGIGGDFEGGYVGVHGSVSPTGSGDYYGVRGKVQSTSGNGTNFGVFASASGPGLNYGIYAEAAGGWGNLAGVFVGPVQVIGDLTVTGTKSFRIDHPADPANKYLNHFCLESSEVLNTYSGNVVLDGGGEAWVQLADWFESINRDPRYQLTCVGGSVPVYVADEISGNRFRIAGGRAGLKVSWQVTAVRNDPAMQKHQVPVEQEKPGPERGRYLDPALYGQPETMRIGYVTPKAAPPSAK